jgi:hypothetical protein
MTRQSERGVRNRVAQGRPASSTNRAQPLFGAGTAPNIIAFAIISVAARAASCRQPGNILFAVTVPINSPLTPNLMENPAMPALTQDNVLVWLHGRRLGLVGDGAFSASSGMLVDGQLVSDARNGAGHSGCCNHQRRYSPRRHRRRRAPQAGAAVCEGKSRPGVCSACPSRGRAGQLIAQALRGTTHPGWKTRSAPC